MSLTLFTETSWLRGNYVTLFILSGISIYKLQYTVTFHQAASKLIFVVTIIIYVNEVTARCPKISDKQFTSEMNNVHPTTRNTPVRSAYSTLFSTDTSFSSIRLSCHVISLPTCTIGADRPTRNNLTVSVSCFM